MFQKFVKNSKGLENNFVKIAKILIIIFMSFSVLVNFIPFFEGSNSYHYGIASILLSHVFVNTAMTVGLIPVKGLPFPFISAGGSFLLTSYLMVGLILKLSVNYTD